ncbi:hypothetical protein [Streptomyces sp. NPDC047981]|uniref:hypothetical protein n=1 Tax=Streptomyces sp. NPDC047981 TaxID=3154610 RepID=UPI003440C107
MADELHESMSRRSAEGAGPEPELALLSLSYEEDIPKLTVAGGTAIPGGIVVVDESGEPVALYTAGPAPSAAPQTRAHPMPGYGSAMFLRPAPK